MSITSRERVRIALDHKEPDRIPLDLGGRVTNIHKTKYEELLAYMGINSNYHADPFYSVMDPDFRVLERLGIDIYYVYLKGPEYICIEEYSDGAYKNEWQITVKHIGQHSQRVTHPLETATLEELKKFPWPNPYHNNRAEGLREQVERIYKETNYALFAAPVNGGLFEFGQHLRGMSRFMIDLMDNKNFTHELLDRILDIQIGLWDVFLGAIGDRIEVAQLADDYGSQNNLLISPQIFNEFFKPRYERLIKFIKSKTEAKIFLHCDGAISKLIPDLIEMGIEILNPIQPTAKGMEPENLKVKFGGQLVFHGAIDNQQLLTKGTVQDVNHAVRHVLATLAPGGGYILSAAHIIEPDIPLENILSMFDTAQTEGIYPITITEN